MIGSLYVNKDMPEQPKQGFFKGLFSAGSSGLDREELCNFNYQIFTTFLELKNFMYFSHFSW